jgi:hypothetical protein
MITEQIGRPAMLSWHGHIHRALIKHFLSAPQCNSSPYLLNKQQCLASNPSLSETITVPAPKNTLNITTASAANPRSKHFTCKNLLWYVLNKIYTLIIT